jgi:hypothetical protein
MNIFEALRLSHDTQRGLALQILEKQRDASELDALYREMKRELAAHAAAEERWFYLHLIEHDSSMGQARHGMAEHHQMDELVGDLDKLEAGTAAWMTQFVKLQEKVFHHLNDEESAIFQLAGKVLTEKQKTELAVGYEEDFLKFRNDKMPISSAESE